MIQECDLAWVNLNLTLMQVDKGQKRKHLEVPDLQQHQVTADCPSIISMIEKC